MGLNGAGRSAQQAANSRQDALLFPRWIDEGPHLPDALQRLVRLEAGGDEISGRHGGRAPAADRAMHVNLAAALDFRADEGSTPRHKSSTLGGVLSTVASCKMAFAGDALVDIAMLQPAHIDHGRDAVMRASAGSRVDNNAARRAKDWG